MEEQQNLFNKVLQEREADYLNQVETQSKTFENLVEQKQKELGLKSEEKTNDFISQEISLEQGFDADTLFGLGRLSGGGEGFSFDAYETAKYDDAGVIKPYLGSVAPKDGSKRSKKWDLHRIALAKRLGLPSKDFVTQEMLNQEGDKQAESFKSFLYEGQDPDSKTVAVDIRQDGVGYFGRPLITVRNPKTGKIINQVMNTPENNATFYSEYNKQAWIEGVQELHSLKRNRNIAAGEGFWDSAGKALSGSVDNLQATAYGVGALIADAIPGSYGEDVGNWFIKQYLRNMEEARINGASNLLSVDEMDWNNPTAVWSKIGASIGEILPSLALMLGTGGIGGFIGKKIATKAVLKKTGNLYSKPAAKVIAKAQGKGQAIGAFAAAEVMEVGGIYGDVAAEGNRDYRDIGLALAGGTAAASLEFIFPAKLMKKYSLGKNAKLTAKNTFGRNSIQTNLKNVGKALLSGSLTEGVTEGLQQIIEETTQEYIKEGHLPAYKSEEFIRSVLDSFTSGFLGGGAVSGGASTASAATNFVKGDVNALESNIESERQDARDAVNEASSDGEGDYQSEIDLNTANINVEKQAKDLGIDLIDGYENLSPTEKSLFLTEALNVIENKQKKLPKGERNGAVLTAQESINTALDNLNTGASGDTAARNIALVNVKLRKKLLNLKNKDKIAEAELAAKIEIDIIKGK